MENASKALIIAGGILIAMIIIGLLLVMINQVGSYQSSDDRNKKNSQVAKFNLDFERYTDNKGITGADIISLINKINDYNKKSNDRDVSDSGLTNYVNYNIKIEITVTGLNKFNNKYAYNDYGRNALFQKDKLENDIDNTNVNALLDTLDKIAKEEDRLGGGLRSREKLKALSSIYNVNDKAGSIEEIRKQLEEWDSSWKDWSATSTNPVSLETIIKYRQYSEFKSSKFKSSQDPVYENGQIQHLFFEFVK